MEVGIKQAKAELSQLIVHAREGTRVFLMNRGKRVAEIVPVAAGEPANERGLGMFRDRMHTPLGWGSQRERERSEREFLESIDGLSE